MALVEHLAQRRVVLVGIDTPSVDPLDSKSLDAHHALNRHGIPNLEGLAFGDVADGLYELIALPFGSPASTPRRCAPCCARRKESSRPQPARTPRRRASSP